MACVGSGKLYTRVEKFRQLRHFTQLQKKIATTTTATTTTAATTAATTCASLRPTILRASGALLQHCQNKMDIPGNRIGLERTVSTTQMQTPGSLPDNQVDPYRLLEDDLKNIFDDIKAKLIVNTSYEELRTISTYYIDGHGKALRPMLSILMARAMNHHKGNNVLHYRQRKIAIISELIHTASLLHDDVIDQANIRRGKSSVNNVWNHQMVAMAGTYIISVATKLLATIRNDDVSITIGQILKDLVRGEFMQLGTKETENERFTQYLTKSYRKTASLMANSVKAATILSDVDADMVETAYQYGRNVGLAFQLVDDLMDFESTPEVMGKSANADLKLGLATAPVLFACEKYPELNEMIMRRFKGPNDAERAFELVRKSNGIEQTRFLAKKHAAEASRLTKAIAKGPYQKALLAVPEMVINRMK